MNNLSSGWTLYLIFSWISLVILFYKIPKKSPPAQLVNIKMNSTSIKDGMINRFQKKIYNMLPGKFMNRNDHNVSGMQEQMSSREKEINTPNINTKKGPSKPIIRWLLIIAYLLFSGIGQIYFLNYPAGERNGMYFYLLAIVVFSILTWYMRDKNPSRNEVQESDDALHWQFSFYKIKLAFQTKTRKSILFSLSIFLSLLSLALLIGRPEQNTHWDIFFLWISSILCYAFVFINISGFDFFKWIGKHKVDILLVLFFTLLGGVFRFHQLGEIPSIIDGDEGRFGLVIVDILEGRITNMFSTVYGNSSLYFFFIAGMMKLFGNSVTILRIGSAIGGTLTIPFLYLMANKLFNRRIAIISTAVLVVSNFHIHFSHIMSVTSIQDALFATLSLYLFYTGLLNKSPSRMAISGLALGFALYIYMGARLIILLIPIYILIMLIIHPKIIKGNVINILIFFGALFIISLPMIYWAISNPDLFNARAHQVGTLQSGWLEKEALKTGQTQIHIFFNLFKQTLLTTIFYPSHGFHFSSWPMLDMFSSIFFIAGLTYSFLNTRDSRFLLLNGWFWSGILVGGALVILPSLNTYRIMIILPVMCLFSGIGLDKLLNFMKGKSGIFNFIETMATVSFIFLIAIFNLNVYFGNFAPNCRYEEPNTRLASRVATYASGLDQDVNLYLLTAPQLRANTHLSMNYLSPGRIYNEFVEPLTGPPENLELQYDYAFFLLPTRSPELQWIEERFPGGTVDQIYDCNISVITVYLWTH